MTVAQAQTIPRSPNLGPGAMAHSLPEGMDISKRLDLDQVLDGIGLSNAVKLE